MKRSMILLGDVTTRGGVVIEGEPSAMNHGRPLAYEGARIFCYSCNSEGRILNVGPYRPMTFKGNQVALENDLCLCKCDPPPRLIASRHDMYMSFETDELARMGYAPNGMAFSVTAAGYDRRFCLIDQDGAPLSGLQVHIETDDGAVRVVKTNAEGLSPVIEGAVGDNATLHLFEGHAQ